MTVSNSASPMNWRISCALVPPTDLRSPTSFARCVARAVARFTKFMHAINSTNTATAPSA